MNTTIKQSAIFGILLLLLNSCGTDIETDPTPVGTDKTAPQIEESAATGPNNEQEESPTMVAPPKPPTVRIENQGLTDQELEAQIQKGLFHDEIAEVILSGNQITVSGLRALLSTPIRSLQVLNLHDNQIGDEGAILLSQSDKLAGVNRLLVGNNGLTIVGIKALFGADSLIVGPTWIDVSDNEVGDEGLEVILNRPYLEFLEGLSLRRSGITDDSALAIADGAQKFKVLQYLDLAGNDLTEAGREALMNNLYLRDTTVEFD